MQIAAGDYIDATLGGALMLSTMAAAGLGNLISDVAGIFCADAIEDRARAYKFGRFPSLSPLQKRLPAVVCAPPALLCGAFACACPPLPRFCLRRCCCFACPALVCGAFACTVGVLLFVCRVPLHACDRRQQNTLASVKLGNR